MDAGLDILTCVHTNTERMLVLHISISTAHV